MVGVVAEVAFPRLFTIYFLFYIRGVLKNSHLSTTPTTERRYPS
nr:MAG TPA: hypothetical protein [Bacteriophage sp.]DAY10161.1 MAG TPA: hypothetical protein [Caudoviricetes sp.]